MAGPPRPAIAVIPIPRHRKSSLINCMRTSEGDGFEKPIPKSPGMLDGSPDPSEVQASPAHTGMPAGWTKARPPGRPETPDA